MMRLTGKQIDELAVILCDVFSREDLVRFVRAELDIRLGEKVESNTLAAETFELVDRLDQEERAIELVRALKKVRSNVSKVREFCDPLLAPLNRSPAESSPPPTDLRAKIEEFNNGFGHRDKIFGYLAAYKGLHELLHALKRFQPSIAAAAAEREKDPSRPLATDVQEFLGDLVKSSSELLAETEFPDRPLPWIDRLATAAKDLAGPDIRKIRRASEHLDVLPTTELRPLNDKLIEQARRLNPKELIASLTDILAGLGANHTSGALRTQLEEFRKDCAELEKLILAHDLCQKIDYDLNQVAELRPVTSDDPMDWVDAKKSLIDLASQKPIDVLVEKASRTNDAAKLFEAANQGKEFEKLKEKFEDLFAETDKALLRVTNKLPRKALALHNALEKLQ